MSTPDLARGITLVTGTDTDVGKTVATAVLASALNQQGIDLVVVKPAQTGLAPDEPGDVQQVGRLAGLDADRCLEWARVPEPLAPATAARRAGVELPTMAEVARRLAALADQHQAVLAEGAGGILVGLDNAGRTSLDLADELAAQGHPARFVVTARAGLGTLNHTALTCAAIRARGHQLVGIVIGSWPDSPDLACRCNRAEISEAADAPLLTCVPEGIGDDPAAVAAHARTLFPHFPI